MRTKKPQFKSQGFNRSQGSSEPKKRRAYVQSDDDYDSEEDNQTKGLSPRFAVWVLLILGFGTLGIAACGPTDIRQALSDVRNQPVDDGVQVADRDPKPLDPEDVAIMVDQAARVTGALSQSVSDELKVDVLPASEIKRPDDGREPLDLRPQNPMVKADHTPLRPKADIADSISQIKQTSPQKNQGGFVQIGTFSSREKAISLAKEAVNGGYKVNMRLEPVEREGRTLYRLKLGPVANASEAKALCSALKILDDWCVRSALS